MNATKGKDKEKSEGCNVQVILRCRPLNKREKEKNYQEILKCSAVRKEVTVCQSAKGQGVDKTKTYTFDGVFGLDSTQREVYAQAVAPIVDEVLKGFNCTIFAYGQTGTGKTYTMEGSHDKEAYWHGPHAGVIPRSINHIFDVLESSGTDYTVSVSFLELYNEELIDLLADDTLEASRSTLRIFDDSVRGITVHPLEEVVVHSAQDIFSILEKSAHKRQTAETQLNHNSSRSHCIFSVLIHTREMTPEGEDLVKTGKLNLVDLAGSENIGRSGAVNQRKREAGMINQSLLTLGRVITALTEHRGHIPYRESKLTRILQDSLGGKTKTCIIATVSPSCDCIEETFSTLDYAHRAKNIRNRPEVNQKVTKKELIKEYTTSIEKLKEELNAARLKNGVFLPKERFDSMEQTLREQRDTLDEMEAQLQNKTQELESLETMFEEKENQLRENISVHNKTKQELSDTSAKLDRTVVDLENTQASLNEHVSLVEEHEAVQEVLHKSAGILTQTLSTTVSHIDGLHGKIDRIRSVSDENKSRSGQFQSQLAKRLSAIEEKFDSWYNTHNKDYQALEESVQRFAGKEKEDVSGLKAKVDRMLSLMSHSAEKIKNTNKEHQEAADQVLGEMTLGEEECRQSISQNLTAAKDGLKDSLKSLRDDLEQKETDISRWCEEACLSIEDQKTKTYDFVSEQEESIAAIHSTMESISEAFQRRTDTQRNIFQQFLEQQQKHNEQVQAEVTQQVAKMLSSFAEKQQAFVSNSVQQFCVALQQSDEDILSMKKAFSEGSHFVQSRAESFRDASAANLAASAKKTTQFTKDLNSTLDTTRKRMAVAEEASVSASDHIDSIHLQHSNSTKKLIRDCKSRIDEGVKQQESSLEEFLFSGQSMHSTITGGMNDLLDSVQGAQEEWTSSIQGLSSEIAGFHSKHQSDLAGMGGEVTTFLASVKDVNQPVTGQTPQRTQYTSLSPSAFPRARKRKHSQVSGDGSTTSTKEENTSDNGPKNKKPSLSSSAPAGETASPAAVAVPSTSGGYPVASKPEKQRSGSKLKAPTVTRSGSVTLRKGNNHNNNNDDAGHSKTSSLPRRPSDTNKENVVNN